MENVRLCSFCHSEAELVCHRCRDAYCSKDCQRIDWPQHKLVCFPMPTLVRPLNENTLIVKSERDALINKAAVQPSLSVIPPSQITNFRNIKLSSDCGKAGIPKQTLVASKANVPTVLTDLKTISTALNIASISDNDKPEEKNSVKPVYFKSDRVDPATIRKPGILSQVLPKQMMGGMSSQATPKQIVVEPPKEKTVTVAPPRQEATKPDPPKKEAPKPEPLKQEAPKPEPPKQEAPKQEVPKPEPPKQIESTPAVSTTSTKKDDSPAELKKPNVEATATQPQQNEVVGPWMQPCPIEDNEFFDVIVQYVAPDSTTWVSLVKNENANNQLLRDINKNISVTSTPHATEVKVHSLFLVLFEEIYYRGMVLQPVSAKDTVSVRLIDYGNEFDLPIGQLKIPLPSMVDQNAYAFAIKFKNPRKAEIGNVIKIRKESMDQDVMTVTVQGETPIFTMKDVDVVPIPVSNKKDLVCLDFSNVGMGYVSACIADKKAIQFVEEMGPKMTEHCTSSKDAEYSPQVNELCFAKFEDNQWYRAVTLKVTDSNKFEILFIDYGNKTTIDSSALRKMVDDFTHPCLTNRCYVKGYSKPSNAEIQKLAVYFNQHQTFLAETIEEENDAYVINVNI